MTLFHREPKPRTTEPIYDIDKTDPRHWILIEIGREPIIKKIGRLKHAVVRIKNCRPGWHRQLGRLAGARLVEPYEWTRGYALSVLPPKPRGSW